MHTSSRSRDDEVVSPWFPPLGDISRATLDLADTATTWQLQLLAFVLAFHRQLEAPPSLHRRA